MALKLCSWDSSTLCAPCISNSWYTLDIVSDCGAQLISGFESVLSGPESFFEFVLWFSVLFHNLSFSCDQVHHLLCTCLPVLHWPSPDSPPACICCTHASSATPSSSDFLLSSHMKINPLHCWPLVFLYPDTFIFEDLVTFCQKACIYFPGSTGSTFSQAFSSFPCSASLSLYHYILNHIYFDFPINWFQDVTMHVGYQI